MILTSHWQHPMANGWDILTVSCSITHHWLKLNSWCIANGCTCVWLSLRKHIYMLSGKSCFTWVGGKFKSHLALFGALSSCPTVPTTLVQKAALKGIMLTHVDWDFSSLEILSTWSVCIQLGATSTVSVMSFLIWIQVCLDKVQSEIFLLANEKTIDTGQQSCSLRTLYTLMMFDT